MRGAWIEITLLPMSMNGAQCRSPCGERGLKYSKPEEPAAEGVSLPVRGAWIEIYLTRNPTALIVAPRAGSVD